ncbi:tryptophan synthase beta subunit-like PLP-dependent enzyme [Emericellopsis atlantica]|uniref:Tryptophan synthase beta subunit-like PLP-dependent enzyme n=1 Tax=Emericellopsis atlantica TaxID=2614577 RepID=A0A9P7ZFV6_9HYPO|nr:tryptophan synthase beta subunit-like PLP-dependent enzyme [Emericellopsis atlantica]KAG9250713.1 tryptophan synthase beta subunit-like PLP-dependent enzyme [Emericellopsis atlantica]
MTSNIRPACHHPLDVIGNTPLLRLGKVIPPGCADIYIKLEYMNPTASYKDRLARAIVEQAEQDGRLTPGMKIVEATGGSTGSSLAYVCALKGYPFRAVCSPVFAPEKLRTMAALGAELDLVESPTGKITPDFFRSLVDRASETADREGWLLANQFKNKDALVGYRALGEELVAQLPQGIDAFCAAVGGAGMAMGVAAVLKERKRDTKVVVLEPASSPLLTEGKTGVHSVDGVGTGFIPPLLDEALYDEARGVSEEEGRDMCRRLAAEEGVFAGVSTGLNVVAAIQLAKELGPGKVVVTVACDSGFKYLNGPLFA